jgi:Flp pilus assembly pilin Flp
MLQIQRQQVQPQKRRKIMSSIKRFLADEAGFTGAEKALLTLVGLGIALVVGRIIQGGSTSAANTVANNLNQSWLPSSLNFW